MISSCDEFASPRGPCDTARTRSRPRASVAPDSTAAAWLTGMTSACSHSSQRTRTRPIFRDRGLRPPCPSAPRRLTSALDAADTSPSSLPWGEGRDNRGGKNCFGLARRDTDAEVAAATERLRCRSTCHSASVTAARLQAPRGWGAVHAQLRRRRRPRPTPASRQQAQPPRPSAAPSRPLRRARPGRTPGVPRRNNDPAGPVGNPRAGLPGNERHPLSSTSTAPSARHRPEVPRRVVRPVQLRLASSTRRGRRPGSQRAPPRSARWGGTAALDITGCGERMPTPAAPSARRSRPRAPASASGKNMEVFGS